MSDTITCPYCKTEMVQRSPIIRCEQCGCDLRPVVVIEGCPHGLKARYIGQPDSDGGPSTGDPNVDVERCALCDMVAWRTRAESSAVLDAAEKMAEALRRLLNIAADHNLEVTNATSAYNAKVALAAYEKIKNR